MGRSTKIAVGVMLVRTEKRSELFLVTVNKRKFGRQDTKKDKIINPLRDGTNALGAKNIC